MKIAEFLLARIAEDEEELGVLAPGVHDDSAGPNDLGWADVGAIGSVLIVSHRRAKADCEAKRRIVELSATWIDRGERATGYDLTAVAEKAQGITAETVLRVLTWPYVSHPDFDPAWRS